MTSSISCDASQECLAARIVVCAPQIVTRAPAGAARNNWRSYREILRALVRTLLDETAGEPRINADAALRLVGAHRLLDADHTWAALETECGARAAGGPAGAAVPSSSSNDTISEIVSM